MCVFGRMRSVSKVREDLRSITKVLSYRGVLLRSKLGIRPTMVSSRKQEGLLKSDRSGLPSLPASHPHLLELFLFTLVWSVVLLVHVSSLPLSLQTVPEQRKGSQGCREGSGIRNFHGLTIHVRYTTRDSLSHLNLLN